MLMGAKASQFLESQVTSMTLLLLLPKRLYMGVGAGCKQGKGMGGLPACENMPSLEVLSIF